MDLTRKLRVVADERVPYLRGVLEPYAEVRYLPGDAIKGADVRDADILITRTRTRCDEALLGGSRVSLVCTATIGTDHIDLPWCASAGIAVESAPGCNAPAVAQYVMAAILSEHTDPTGLILGIVGVGHVGSIVDRWARSLGMHTLLCDPPRARREGSDRFVNHAELLSLSDIISYHVPLTRTGEDATVGLFGPEALAKVKRRPLLLNTCRGPVTATGSLLHGLDEGSLRAVAIDCWEGEPNIDHSLLARAAVATPHIAGYSRQGKLRATAMVLDAISRRFALPKLTPALPVGMSLPAPVPDAVTCHEILSTYDIAADTRALKADPSRFEALRNEYALRREPEQ
ncbi:MAG: 4-phosphoerythronate dehydrogenase [Candidatus Amulumruptor caecigallinarius]|nr:4-phosphoerythronate dehydrogenase [Candidatus Amulumruptor caecigallinarius]MCM1397383.1 4-phosphoerythronate dehydrogenase [Candidatus Amulumruptor caecigallinarius]MCM1454751.1 4-phosphoerythronate dehydrogenase [bacterium]